MWLRHALVSALLVGLCGCLSPNLVPCGALACSAGQLCVADQCVSPAQAAACAGVADGVACAFAAVTRGACSGGACFAVVCGDGRRQLDEVCDDGNTIDGDGCAANCASTEQCGNGVLDVHVGEQCDDGLAGVSGDGCSSRCQLELEAWSDASPRNIPPRGHAGAAFDTARQVAVVFGGEDFATLYDDTWEWDGVTWRPREVAIHPSARSLHGMVYDELHEVTVVYGGVDQTGAQYDTWTWDGVTWTRHTPAHSPGLAPPFAMAWFPTVNVVTLTGNGETWSWNGTDWIDDSVAAGAAPSGPDPAMSYDGSTSLVFYGQQGGDQFASTLGYDGRWVLLPFSLNPTQSCALAYDGGLGTALMFGGSDGGATLYQQTYRWGGQIAGWSDAAPLASPPARSSPAMVYDGARGDMVLFGGFGTTGALGDTWTYAGNTWTEHPLPSPSPPRRTASQLAYDPIRGQTVLFGGTDGQTPSNDTWLWDGHTWAVQSGLVAPLPTARSGHAMCAAAERGVVVMFGGTNGTRLGDTWELDAAGWHERSAGTVMPVARFDQAMACDTSRGVAVMFGGSTGAAPDLEDATTYTWDGATWTPHASTPRPRARYGHRMVYDPIRDRVVLFGGNPIGGTAGALADTWEWDGASWTDVTPALAADSPPPRFEHVMTYDAQARRVVITGGLTSAGGILGDAWAWDGTRWRQLTDLHSPVRWGAAITFDAIRRQVVLFGGTTFTGTTSDTWALAFTRDGEPIETCVDASADLDGDGLAGCADPDCWGRCAPLCPPGMTCGPGAPRCGDGACMTAIEDHALCPADCP